MKFLYGPTREGIFVGVKDSNQILNYMKGVVGNIFCRTEVWYIDLDDNLAKSPAKAIAMRAIGTKHYDLRYIDWCINTALELILHGKTAESRTWLEYVNNFLKDDKLEVELAKFAEGFVEKSLYPGVPDLMDLIDGKRKMLITRNVSAIAEAYAKRLGLRFVANAWNKREVVAENLFEGSASVMGDSGEDVEMLEGLNMGSRCLFYTLRNPKQELLDISDPVVYTSRDRRGLVEVLTK